MWSPDLGMEVKLKLSGFTGCVVAVCQYLYSDTMYQVEYVDNNGNPQTAWLHMGQISPQD